MLKFPIWEELSKDEQVPIYNLSLDKNYVITGGPGTGKTVLAIHRAARLKDEVGEGKVKFLVFNKPLMLYLKRVLEETQLKVEDENDSFDVDVQTWHSWFYGFYSRFMNSPVPQKRDYEPDWNRIMNDSRFVRLINETTLWDHLIIDEAQDFPLELLEILKRLSKNVTIFADPNQSILSNDTNIAEILRIFEAGERRFYLTRNYRNTFEIYNVGKVFYTGEPSNLPGQPIRTGNKPRIIAYENEEVVYKRIKNYAENNPTSNIGIILYDFKNAKDFFNNLKKYIDKKICKVMLYRHSRNIEDYFNFDEPGIKIIYNWVMKGLEFDTVFLPRLTDIDFILKDPLDPLKINQIYVATTRAKNDVFYFYEKDKEDLSFVIRKLKLKENRNLVEWEVSNG